MVISALQVAKHPFITPGPSTVFTPPPTRHSTLPGVAQGVLAGITMTGSLPHYYGSMTPVLGLKNTDAGSVSSSGYPTPRPGSAASGFDTSFYMGSPQIGASGGPGNLFRSFPRPHSSPKMKLRQSELHEKCRHCTYFCFIFRKLVAFFLFIWLESIFFYVTLVLYVLYPSHGYCQVSGEQL